MNRPTPTVRINPDNPDHHVYSNNGVWWIHYSIRTDPRFKSQRVRASLGTRSIEVARERRDAILTHLDLHAGLATPATPMRTAAAA
jgi:hypothetical protein